MRMLKMTIQIQKETFFLNISLKVSIRTAHMIDCFANLWFWFVLEVGPLGPVKGDGSSSLQFKKTKQSQTNK